MTGSVFGTDWRTSEPEYDVVVERDVRIPVDDGVELVGDLFRPDGAGPVPLLAGFHPYNTEFQSAPIRPKAVCSQLAWVEGGDPRYFARRGYAHAVVNVRGTGKSGGEFRNMGPREVADVATALEDLAGRDWCDGTAGLLGLAYFGALAKRVAARNPDPLAAIFAPWSFTDPYRDLFYHGGILAHGYLLEFAAHLDNPRPRGWTRETLSAGAFTDRVDRALRDEEVYAHERLAEALESPEAGVNPLLVDVVLGGLDGEGEYFAERRLDYGGTTAPAYLGADWGHHAGHLAAAFRSRRNWEGPTKLLIGPDVYLDRPFYQLHGEALRWFDRHLKGRETGIEAEPPIRLFERGGDAGWKAAAEWPLPSTRWVPFRLHERGLLSERDHQPNEGYTTFEDSPFRREGVQFVTPPAVERTEVFGPPRLSLYAATTGTELPLFVSLLAVEEGEAGEAGDGRELTRGWLRGSQRELAETEAPWAVEHTHDGREPLEPGAVYRFEVGLRETGYVLTPGERLCLRVACTDAGGIDWVGGAEGAPDGDGEGGYVSSGHLAGQSAARVTVHHEADHPSCLALPVASGNVLGTYLSGGEAPDDPGGRFPARKVGRDERPGSGGGG